MGMQMDYKEDDIILKEKAESRFMYLILQGEVALYSGYQTKEEYLFGLVGKGKTFGEIGLLNHENSIYTAVAVTNVKVAVFSEFELGSFIRNYPDQALGVMRSVARMNKVFKMNLKMVMEENKDYAKYKEVYLEAMKSGPEEETVEVTAEDANPEWRSSRLHLTSK